MRSFANTKRNGRTPKEMITELWWLFVMNYYDMLKNRPQDLKSADRSVLARFFKDNGITLETMGNRDMTEALGELIDLDLPEFDEPETDMEQ